ncbi:MAG: triphosphoribosyl-dephospho-CoA synthase [Eubacteriales bacterium]|nr:triphosphoribosyl-dephospho-CoA synthase [Eubacteriales bacterium]
MTDVILHLVAEALRLELYTAPKPGLVDRHNSGAHRDLSYEIMAADIPLVVSQARLALNLAKARPQLDSLAAFNALRSNGQRLESKLGGGKTNTYKGLVFAFSFLAYDLELIIKEADNCTEFISSWRKQISCLAEFAQKDYREANRDFMSGFGYQAKLIHGRNGAREEALWAYPLVFEEALRLYAQGIGRGLSQESAALLCLMLFISKLSDSNLYKRIGYRQARLWQVKVGKKLRVLRDNLNNEDAGENTIELVRYMTELDRRFIEQNASPGGAADHLAILFFVVEILKQYFPGWQEQFK